MVMARHGSWGNYPQARHRIHRQRWRQDPLPAAGSESMLPHGLGRSYGDSCLNDGGMLIDTTGLDHLIDFNEQTGRLRCEAGVSLGTILRLMAPRGWFPPVVPGTCHVTVGGAIANDIHGKNHHRTGTFGRWVPRFELLRSDGRRMTCAPDENPDWFAATLGGLGLTGLITWAEIDLKRIPGQSIDYQTVRFECLDEFFDLARQSDESFEYTVAWIDAFAKKPRLGRGHFIRGNHCADGDRAPRSGGSGLRVPFDAPSLLLHPWNMRLFNALYYLRQRKQVVRRVVPYTPFFFPLDSIRDWNRLYGKRGFLQHQSVVPTDGGQEAIRRMLEKIVEAGEGSFLAVLKLFGDLPSPGMLSFPAPGVTLALDFPHRGKSTLGLLDELDAVVRDRGGRVYPAKDARMSADSFRRFFPAWEDFSAYVDPAFSSSFWRRVTSRREKTPS